MATKTIRNESNTQNAKCLMQRISNSVYRNSDTDQQKKLVSIEPISTYLAWGIVVFQKFCNYMHIYLCEKFCKYTMISNMYLSYPKILTNAISTTPIWHVQWSCSKISETICTATFGKGVVNTQ